VLRGIGNEAQARRALEEIERLMRQAAVEGVRLDPWLVEIVEELRANWPEIDTAGAAEIARRVTQRPRMSLAAQGRIRVSTIRALKP
jgi:hypothetical protein